MRTKIIVVAVTSILLLASCKSKKPGYELEQPYTPAPTQDIMPVPGTLPDTIRLSPDSTKKPYGMSIPKGKEQVAALIDESAVHGRL